MPQIEKTQVQRDYAVVDLIRSLPPVTGYTAIDEILSESERNALYAFLVRVHDERAPKCSQCGELITEDRAVVYAPDICSDCLDQAREDDAASRAFDCAREFAL